MKYPVLIFILMVIVEANCVDLLLPSSASQNASSGLIFIARSPSGTRYNPAYAQKGLEVGMSYLFNNPELAYYTLHAAYKTGEYNFYAGGVHLNNPLYRETLLCLNTSYRHKDISLGVTCRLLNISIPNYHNTAKLTADAGVIWQTEKVRTGFSLKNITRSRMGTDTLPIVYLTEINYRITENGSVSIGTEKEQGYEFSYKIGSSYGISEHLSIVASFQHNPARVGTGIVIVLPPVTVNYGVSTHRYLPETHYVSVGYDFLK